MALETFRVAEYLGPKDRKECALNAGTMIVFEPQLTIEGIPCATEVDVTEDIFKDVEAEVEVDDVVFSDGPDGKPVKKVVGKKLVKQIVGKKKVGTKVVGRKTVGRKVAIVRGEDNCETYLRAVRDSQRSGENYYGYADDLEQDVKKVEMESIIRPIVEGILEAHGLLGENHRGPGRPPGSKNK